MYGEKELRVAVFFTGKLFLCGSRRRMWVRESARVHVWCVTGMMGYNPIHLSFLIMAGRDRWAGGTHAFTINQIFIVRSVK